MICSCIKIQTLQIIMCIVGWNYNCGIITCWHLMHVIIEYYLHIGTCANWVLLINTSFNSMLVLILIWSHLFMVVKLHKKMSKHVVANYVCNMMGALKDNINSFHETNMWNDTFMCWYGSLVWHVNYKV